MKRTVWIEIEEPAEWQRVPTWIPIPAKDGKAFDALRVLGHPVPALPEALSPEARSVLDYIPHYIAEPIGLNHTKLMEKVAAYAATLTPPDPLRQAREALERARVAFGSGMRESVNAELGNVAHALDRLAEQGGAA